LRALEFVFPAWSGAPALALLSTGRRALGTAARAAARQVVHQRLGLDNSSNAGRATLIDWGSSRAGPAALDLANLVTADSADVARYARTWQQLTGQPPPAAAIEVGYRWAAPQIPVQYLPWTTAHQPTRDVEAALDRIERALDRLAA
jgi:hypothetical protein